MRVRIKGLEYVEPAELVDHPKNWRSHPAHQRDKLKQVMEKIGVAGALIAYKSKATGKMTVIDGHLRKEMMSQTEEKVPVLVLDVNDQEAEALLATYDVITEMADPMEEVYADLVKGLLAEKDYAELVREFDDATQQKTEEEVAGGKPVYEIVPDFDEGYDAFIVVCKRETESAQVQTVLDLKKKKDRRGKVGISQVIPAEEFIRKWMSR